MNNYQSVFGFTIGPIYEMMSHAKKTRELWFSSYFFSWYVKLFCEKVKEPDYQIIIPIINGLPEKSRAGFYPDHVIGYSSKSIEETKTELISFVESIIKDFSDIIDDLIKQEDGTSTGATFKILSNYLQTNIACIDKKDITDDKNAVDKIEKFLLAFEKNRSYSLGENEKACYRCKSLPSVVHVKEYYDEPKEYDLCPLCFFKLRAHKSSKLLEIVNLRKNKPYPPLASITTKELHRIKEHNDINKKIFSGEKEDLVKNDFMRTQDGKNICDLKLYHKYLAIVNADGDDLGKLVSNMSSPKELSEKLVSFSVEAYKLNAEYGVEPIYLGGDDLLIFMPVIYKGKTVIDYILKLKELYQAEVKSDVSNPTISIGVGISYYKYPLSIALKDAQDLLFLNAKNEPGKNSVVLQLTQHSGSKSLLKFSFNDHTICKFNNLLKAIIESEKSGSPIHPHAIHHKLIKFRTLLTNVNDEKQINEFFRNEFNEKVHDDMSGITQVKELLLSNISASDDTNKVVLYPKKELEKQFDNCMHQIKFIKFLIGE